MNKRDKKWRIKLLKDNIRIFCSQRSFAIFRINSLISMMLLNIINVEARRCRTIICFELSVNRYALRFECARIKKHRSCFQRCTYFIRVMSYTLKSSCIRRWFVKANENIQRRKSETHYVKSSSCCRSLKRRIMTSQSIYR